MGEALRIVYRTISGFMIRKAELTHSGAVRRGHPDSAHWQRTELERALSAPTRAELQALVQRISARFGRHLKRKGLLVRDLERNHLAFEPGSEDNALADLQGHSITYR
jgi:hypothetical protein